MTDKSPEKIQNLFDEISEYYDKVNNFISLGTHYFIKFLALRALEIRPRTMILDICCGTGDFTQLVQKFYPRARIIGVDFSRNMLNLAKIKNPKGVFLQADCTDLPFKENDFDFVTVGFGLRNVQNREKAISEVYRILNDGGKFLHLDFGRHDGVSRFFDVLVPVVAKLLNLQTEHYKYLTASKNEFPEPEELIKEFERAGFELVKRVDFLFGAISAQILQTKKMRNVLLEK